MLKNAYLKKNCKKSPHRRGLRSRTPVCLQLLGTPPQTPALLLPPTI